MPQSHSYKNWLEKALKKPNLSDLEITYRIVPLITGDKGTKEMAQMAKDFALELNDSVDVFMTPNDQMGISEDFIRNVSENSTKPLIGISRNNVTERWGATAVIYPSHLSMGRQSGKMIIRLLEGASIKDIPAEEPEENGFAFDLNKVKEFGLTIPMKFIELAGEQNIIRSDSN
jgi:putative ABC transport system substrate-binding protein